MQQAQRAVKIRDPLPERIFFHTMLPSPAHLDTQAKCKKVALPTFVSNLSVASLRT